MWTDIFNDDAFSLVSLTAAINNVDYVPGRAGALAFVGAGEGVATTSVSIESRATVLSLIKTTPRGSPGAVEDARPRATVRNVAIPHLQLEDTIQAESVQNVRAFGTTNELLGPLTVVNQQITKMSQRHDLTLENLRLGALRGQILDSDSTDLVNLFSLFGITNDNSGADVGSGSSTDAAAKKFNMEFDFSLSSEEDANTAVRIKAQEIVRFIARGAKMPIPNTARYWAFCGDNFFDALVERPDIKRAYLNTAQAQQQLGSNFAFGVFEWGGIVWENYRGTDDNATVAIDTDEAIVFLTGVPGLYAEYFAPADFMETVNTIGLPRYAKVAPDPKFNRYVEVHTQQNPLPLCLRPQTLVRLLKS